MAKKPSIAGWAATGFHSRRGRCRETIPVTSQYAPFQAVFDRLVTVHDQRRPLLLDGKRAHHAAPSARDPSPEVQDQARGPLAAARRRVPSTIKLGGRRVGRQVLELEENWTQTLGELACPSRIGRRAASA